MSATDVSEGQVVQGYITFVGSAASWTGPQFISFSYSVNGQRFHQSLGETVDAWSTATIRKASYGLKVGDSVSVWCSISLRSGSVLYRRKAGRETSNCAFNRGSGFDRGYLKLIHVLQVEFCVFHAGTFAALRTIRSPVLAAE